MNVIISLTNGLVKHYRVSYHDDNRFWVRRPSLVHGKMQALFCFLHHVVACVT